MATSDFQTTHGPPSRCPRCRYSLEGLPCPHRCPECGFGYDDRIETWRSERSKPISVYVVLMLLALCAFLLDFVFNSNSTSWRFPYGAIFFPIMIGPMIVSYLRRRRVIVGTEGVLIQGQLYGWQYLRWSQLKYDADQLAVFGKTNVFDSFEQLFAPDEVADMVLAVKKRIEEQLDRTGREQIEDEAESA